MYISFNASAVIANDSLNKTDKRIQSSLARLSSGLKVVNPKDNPSGLAMAKRMNAQISGVSQAKNNSSDGVSIIEIADGTMTEMSDMLQRMNELSVKAATGTITDSDREMINKEVKQLKDELTRISKETSFNGQPILDGSFDLKGYVSNPTNPADADALTMKVSYYSDSVTYGKYTLDAGFTVNYDADGIISSVSTPVVRDPNGNPIPNLSVTTSGNTVTMRNETGWEMKITSVSNGAASRSYAALELDITGIGSMDMQIGANEGQQLGIRIPKMSLENMEIANVDVSTEEGANDAIEKIKTAMRYLSSARADLGAYQNRLEHTISSLDITNENMTSAYSRIMDVDMAEEMTEYTTLQILSQSSTSMLAQANDRPSQVLQLLQ